MQPIKNTLRNYFDNRSGTGETIFISLFYALYLVYRVFHNTDLSLYDFTGRPISAATSEGIDVAKRVFAFYRGFGIFILLVFSSNRFLGQVRSWIPDSGLRILNATSAAGFLFLFFLLTGTDISPAIHLVIAIHLACLAAWTVKNIFKEEGDASHQTVFIWLFTLAVCLYFPFAEMVRRLGWTHPASLPWFSTIVAALFSIVYYYLSARQPDKKRFTSRLIFLTQPLSMLPLILFLSAELYIIFNQHGIHVVRPTMLFLILLVFPALRMLLLARRKSSIQEPLAGKKIIYRDWFPWIIAGLTCLAFYHPVVSVDIDWFEDANHILPLQQFHDFGKMPFIHTFSSHALSDFGFGFLYWILNGYDPFGGYVYAFLMQAIVSLVVYYFVYRISENGPLALFLALFYPYTELILPGYYNLIPLTLLALLNIYRSQTAINYFLFFCVLLLMIIWRIDLGSANLMAGIGGLLVLLFIVPGFTTNRKALLRGFAFFYVAGAAVGLALFARYGSLLLHHFNDALGYISLYQSYGVKDLAGAHDLKYFSLYYIMPVAVLIAAGYAFVRLLRADADDRSTVLLSFSLIFLSVFYLANFQRGLVRHTLVEQWDTALTSYGFFILAATSFYPQKNRYTLRGFFTFTVLSTLIIVNYKFSVPESAFDNSYNYVVKRMQTRFLPEHNPMTIVRAPEDPVYRRNDYGDMAEFLKTNFPDSATFLDFSNTPMLYSFLHRSIPNYFCQIPHTAHNENMQRRFLEELKGYNIPVVIFENYPQNFWDHLDGIPNVFRHYRIAEYIYTNYEPFAVINHHTVWLRKGFYAPALKRKNIYEKNNLASTPLHDAALTDSISVKSTGDHPRFENLLSHPLLLDPSKKYYLLLNGHSDREGTFVIVADFGKDHEQTTEVHAFGGEMKLFAILQPTPDQKELKGLQVFLPPGSAVSMKSLQVMESNFIPDEVSDRAEEHSLRLIPYFWGQYDGDLPEGRFPTEAVLMKPSQTISSDHLFNIGLPEIPEKEQGNYLRLNACALGGKTVDLIVRYGLNDETQGSFVLKIKSRDTEQDYLIRISSQYNWVSKEHNWLSVYPVGGDIRLSAADILKGD